MTFLPPETLLQIFEYLESDFILHARDYDCNTLSSQADLLHCALTCRFWALYSLPLLWQIPRPRPNKLCEFVAAIESNSASHHKPEKNIRQVLSRPYGHFILSLIIGGYEWTEWAEWAEHETDADIDVDADTDTDADAESLFLRILPHCAEVDEIRLVFKHVCPLTRVSLSAIAHHCGLNLSVLEFNNEWPDSRDIRDIADTVKEICLRCPNIVALEVQAARPRMICHFATLTKLEEVELSRIEGFNPFSDGYEQPASDLLLTLTKLISNNSPHLTVLNLDPDELIVYKDPSFLNAVASCHNLCRLSIAFIHFDVSETVWSNLAMGPSKLECLELPYGMPAKHFLSLLRRNRATLKVLDLHIEETVTIYALADYLRAVPQLQRLKLFFDDASEHFKRAVRVLKKYATKLIWIEFLPSIPFEMEFDGEKVAKLRDALTDDLIKRLEQGEEAGEGMDEQEEEVEEKIYL